MQKWSKRQLHERPIPYSCSERWRWSGSQDVVAVMKSAAYRLTVCAVSGHQRWLMNRESSLKRQSIFGTCTFQVTNIVEIFGPPSRSTQQRLSWPGKPSDPKISPCCKTAKRENSTPYLFQYRRKKIGEAYITDRLIPLLCKAAGLTSELGKPYKDAIGPITSHRARSSTAYYLKAMGMTPYDIGKLLGHTNPNRTLPWYLKENLHQLGRMYRKANPLDRTVHALLDTDAAGKGAPCVFYYLAENSQGRPRLCGNPNFLTCYHQLQCAECAAYVEVEMAEVIEKRPGALHISVPIPLPEQLVEDLLKQEEGSPVGEPPSPPPLPSPAFHFNKKVAACMASDQSRSEGDQLRLRLKDLEAQLTTKRKHDTRNVSLRLLKQEIGELKSRLAELERGNEANE